MASRVELGRNNRVTGVHYFDRHGEAHFQKARAVIIAGYSIELPRLLLNSACPGYENGLANSSDTVGRYLMAQAGNVVLGRFDQPVRMYKAPPAHGTHRRVLRDKSEEQLRSWLCDPDRRSTAHSIRQTDAFIKLISDDLRSVLIQQQLTKRFCST